uniref:YKT6 v-SNARE-like protein n=1 Tax=Myotis myotis TaxID=51298 RepID=A0A7J7V5G1_MYOMY|nr:YKT6 v-SNARE-like protein [Myotis myotis]
MKLFSLSVLYKGDPKAVLLSAAYDVSSFSFFQRTSVQEFMTFTSQLIVERSAKGNRKHSMIPADAEGLLSNLYINCVNASVRGFSIHRARGDSTHWVLLGKPPGSRGWDKQGHEEAAPGIHKF